MSYLAVLCGEISGNVAGLLWHYSWAYLWKSSGYCSWKMQRSYSGYRIKVELSSQYCRGLAEFQQASFLLFQWKSSSVHVYIYLLAMLADFQRSFQQQCSIFALVEMQRSFIAGFQQCSIFALAEMQQFIASFQGFTIICFRGNVAAIFYSRFLAVIADFYGCLNIYLVVELQQSFIVNLKQICQLLTVFLYILFSQHVPVYTYMYTCS